MWLPGWLSMGPQTCSARNSRLQGSVHWRLHSRNSSGAKLLLWWPQLNGFSYLVPVPLVITFSSVKQVWWCDCPWPCHIPLFLYIYIYMCVCVYIYIYIYVCICFIILFWASSSPSPAYLPQSLQIWSQKGAALGSYVDFTAPPGPHVWPHRGRHGHRAGLRNPETALRRMWSRGETV